MIYWYHRKCLFNIQEMLFPCLTWLIRRKAYTVMGYDCYIHVIFKILYMLLYHMMFYYTKHQYVSIHSFLFWSYWNINENIFTTVIGKMENQATSILTIPYLYVYCLSKLDKIDVYTSLHDTQTDVLLLLNVIDLPI